MGACDRRHRGRPLGAGRRRHRRGVGVLLGWATPAGSRASPTPASTTSATGWCRSTARGSRSASSRCPPSQPSTATRSVPDCAWRWRATSATPHGTPSSASPSSSWGCTPGMAGTYLLPNVVGAAHARDLLLTGRVVEADEALRIGLVSRVIESASFDDEVLDIAAGIATTAPIATQPDQDRARRRRPRRLRERPAVGGAGPADDAGHRRPAGGDPGQPREASTGLRRR